MSSPEQQILDLQEKVCFLEEQVDQLIKNEGLMQQNLFKMEKKVERFERLLKQFIAEKKDASEEAL